MNPFFRASNQSFYPLSRRFKDLGSRAVANNAEADILFADAANAQLHLTRMAAIFWKGVLKRIRFKLNLFIKIRRALG
ncbi:hypothetical protein [Methylocystis echinoides]|uniref:hypothetical protein n=1 Tax=Methylocystis echinoides TaxID=29468 RepID=UPI0034185715